jgi:hypothetical protein
MLVCEREFTFISSDEEYVVLSVIQCVTEECVCVKEAKIMTLKNKFKPFPPVDENRRIFIIRPR